jgi:hypothetical protein
MSGVNALGALTPVCLPTVAPQATVTVTLPPAPVHHGKPPKPHGPPKPPGHDHHHDHHGHDHHGPGGDGGGDQ